jgi:hypothetical protein
MSVCYLEVPRFYRMCTLKNKQLFTSAVKPRQFVLLRILCCLHNLHEMDAYKADRACLSVCFDERTARRILMKLSMDIIILEDIPNSYFLISCNQ